jgi:hypothetical protein
MPDSLQTLLNEARSSDTSLIGLICIAALGGAVAHLNKVATTGAKLTVLGLCLEIMTSIFVGIVTALLCAEAEFSFYLTSALVALSGHAGTKILVIYEKVIGKKIFANIK